MSSISEFVQLKMVNIQKSIYQRNLLTLVSFVVICISSSCTPPEAEIEGIRGGNLEITLVENSTGERARNVIVKTLKENNLLEKNIKKVQP